MKVTSAPDLVFFMTFHDFNLFLALFGPSKSSQERTKSDEKKTTERVCQKTGIWVATEWRDPRGGHGKGWNPGPPN